MEKNQTLEVITETIFNNSFYIFPLYSVVNGKCTCKNAQCESPGKHPLFKYSWKIIASNNKEKITQWFSAYQKMNFGLATGRLSKVTNKYLVVIDVDTQKHPFIQTLPNTFSYRTGSGGWHFWFWSKYPIKNSVSFLADKVDVRGTDGYVVIPPSKHCKGLYNNINNAEIADLPKPVLSKLLEKPTISKTSSSKPKKKVAPSIASVWAIEPVSKVRDMMQTQQVPEGVRNVVMHRLLSSDRARGALKGELKKNANAYLKHFVKSQELSSELPTIIESVMKYPAYNNSHEKVNELYVSWLKKNKNVELKPTEVKSLTTTDSAFFALLKPSNPKLYRCSLQQVLDARMAYMRSAGLLHISNYKVQLLAKKLTELGFTRTRTAKGNWWNVDLSKIVPQEK